MGVDFKGDLHLDRARWCSQFSVRLVAVYALDRKRDSKPDPAKPMSGWRTAWRSLTRAIQCPECGQLQQPAKECENCKADIHSLKSPLHSLRFHDLRHHAITELAESQASERTIMSIAGHISPRMLDHYSHVRIQAKREALDAISRKPARSDSRGFAEGYGTNNGTTSGDSRVPFAQVAEKYGGDDETRTRDLCRDRVGTLSTLNNLQGCWGLPST